MKHLRNDALHALSLRSSFVNVYDWDGAWATMRRRLRFDYNITRMSDTDYFTPIRRAISLKMTGGRDFW